MSNEFQNAVLVPSFIHTKGEAPPSGELETVTPSAQEAHAVIKKFTLTHKEQRELENWTPTPGPALDVILQGCGIPPDLYAPDNKDGKSERPPKGLHLPVPEGPVAQQVVPGPETAVGQETGP